MESTPEELLAQLHRAKVVRDQADELVSELTESLTGVMQDKGITSIKVMDDGGEYSAIAGTLVQASRIVIDEDRLKKALGAQAWGKVTKTVLDKPKLEDAIARSEVDANVVAQCSEEKMNKPFVKITAKAMPKKALAPRRKPVSK